MEKYNLPNPNCKTCYGGHVNTLAKPVSRLEECPNCSKVVYPKDFVLESQMDDKGNVIPGTAKAKPFGGMVKPPVTEPKKGSKEIDSKDEDKEK